MTNTGYVDDLPEWAHHLIIDLIEQRQVSSALLIGIRDALDADDLERGRTLASWVWGGLSTEDTSPSPDVRRAAAAEEAQHRIDTARRALSMTDRGTLSVRGVRSAANEGVPRSPTP